MLKNFLKFGKFGKNKNLKTLQNTTTLYFLIKLQIFCGLTWVKMEMSYFILHFEFWIA